MNSSMNWGYKTAPQENCHNRELDYSRGKGLGGSSAINFGVYTVGARDDYEEWARIVGDDAYRWDKIQPRFKRLETFHSALPAGIDAKYANSKPEDHGNSGPLHVGFASEWERDLPPMLDLFEEAGFPLNPDHNSGNPIGMSVLVNSSHNGRRSTSNDLLTPMPDNLTVITVSPVHRILLEGTKAVGVESNGTRYFASKEVVLSAGSLNSPKILMHSGIGPRDQLEKFNIPVVKDMPPIGQGLRDHMFCPVVYTRKEGDTDRASFYGDQKVMDEALEQWKSNGTGPWSKFACELGIGFFKLEDMTEWEEFKSLPAAEQQLLTKETIPHYEIITHFPIHWFIPGFPSENLNYSAFLVFYLNAQSRGEVTLQSADPDAPLKFDPKFLGSAFDRRVAIESLRQVFRIAKHEGYTKNTDTMMAGPKGDSEEELLDYWKQTISSSWHMTGTVKMGKTGDADAVVDSDFHLMGVDKLRVSDMSVVPVLGSCHVQAVAYVTGMICAEKLIVEYNLA
jgi:choline dehydrogenase-like flavoprotein